MNSKKTSKTYHLDDEIKIKSKAIYIDSFVKMENNKIEDCKSIETPNVLIKPLVITKEIAELSNDDSEIIIVNSDFKKTTLVLPLKPIDAKKFKIYKLEKTQKLKIYGETNKNKKSFFGKKLNHFIVKDKKIEVIYSDELKMWVVL